MSDHPWLRAIQMGIAPQPVPVNIMFDAIDITGPDGQKETAVMMTLVDTTGVKTAFINPQGLVVLMQNAAQVLAQIEQDSGKLIVANEGQMKETVRNAEAANKIILGK